MGATAGAIQPIYLNGYSFAFPSLPVTPVPVFGESVRRLRDGTLSAAVHRAAVTDPDVSTKFRFEIEWPELTDADVEVWNECVALRGPFLFCPWFMWSEPFSFLEGEAIAGNFQRASAKDEIPGALAAGTPATDYDVTFKLDGVASTDFAVSAMSGYRTPWAASPAANAGAGGALVVGSYAPLFRVRIVDQTPVLLTGARGGRLIAEEY